MTEKETIFKRLKQHYNYLLDNGYEVIYLALQGSQNYNLQIHSEEYQSDIDSKAIILPSFDDFINGKEPISEVIVLDNNEHIDVKDIRVMFKLFEKQNLQFLEILFTDYKIINKTYKDLVTELLNQAEDIAKINSNAFWNCLSGMSMEKLKALEHPYPAIIDKIEKWGYDGKQLHHII